MRGSIMKPFKKLLAGFTILSMTTAILLAMPANANAATTADFENAQSITIGEKTRGSVGEDPNAWFKFTTSQNPEPWYRIGCVYKDDSNFGPSMFLYDVEGNELTEKGLKDGVDNMEYTKLKPGTDYYVYLRFAKDTVTDYTFCVDEIKDDISDNEDNAVPILNGIKTVGNFEYVDDVDYYTFTAGAVKTTITATVKYNEKDAKIYVYSEDGVELVDESVYDGKSRSVTFDTTKGDKYFIKFAAVPPYLGTYRDAGKHFLTIKSGSTDLKNLQIDDVLNKSQDVYIFNGKVRLIKGTDYTLSIGALKGRKATVTLKGKGNYTGTVVKEFSVIAR